MLLILIFILIFKNISNARLLPSNRNVYSLQSETDLDFNSILFLIID